MTACAGPGASTGSPSPTPASSASSSTGTPGSIAGKLSFPSEFIPPMTVFAIRQAGQGAAFYTVGTVKNQGAYSIRGVAPGTYHLYAGVGVEGNTRGRFLGGYTQDVLCGLAYGCTDNRSIVFVVSV